MQHSRALLRLVQVEIGSIPLLVEFQTVRPVTISVISAPPIR